jgi:GTP-binding protein
VPNLGVVPYREHRSFVMADIPGIIEGAHEGRGLGVRFLRHIERNSMLLFLIPCDSNDIIRDYEILLNELEKYNPELLDKKRLLGISKADLLDDELYDALKNDLEKQLKKKHRIPFILFSSQSGKGVQILKDQLWKMLNG